MLPFSPEALEKDYSSPVTLLQDSWNTSPAIL